MAADRGDGVVLYAAVGPSLTRYAVDVDAAGLVRAETVTLPENVQYAWPHASLRHIYVASSSGIPGGEPRAEDRHHLSAFAIDPSTGALTPHGAPVRLPARPIHIATDVPSTHVLAAFNNPAAVRVYRINADATLGGEVAQSASIDPGIYPHRCCRRRTTRASS